MSFQKMICFMFLSEFIIHYSWKGHVDARMWRNIYDGDSNNSEDRLLSNCVDNDSLSGTNEGEKKYPYLRLDLASLTQRILEDELNRFVEGYISEEQLAKLLLTFLQTHNGTTNDGIHDNALHFKPTLMDMNGAENSINEIKNGEMPLEPYKNLGFTIKKTSHWNNQDSLAKSSIEASLTNQSCNNSCSNDIDSNSIKKDHNYRQTYDFNETTCNNRLPTDITEMCFAGNDSNFVNCNVIPTTTSAAVKNLKPKELIDTVKNISATMDTGNLIIDAIKALKVVRSAFSVTDGWNKSTELESEMVLTRENDRGDFEKILTLLDVMTNLSSGDKGQLLDHHDGKAIKRSAPACPHTPNRPWSKYNPFLYAINYTGTFVTSCFVCGLEEHQIPFNTICQDAFSDDVSLHHHQQGFGKYCRYEKDTANYCVDKRDPHSVWGRWTGGCSMRRIDISGIYTQRTCRNEKMPTMGNHFASHRMAKLELTLHGVGDGCVLSPSASLVPLSRSVSLYARFVACVCSGQWCNVGASYSNISYETILLWTILMYFNFNYLLLSYGYVI